MQALPKNHSGRASLADAKVLGCVLECAVRTGDPAVLEEYGPRAHVRVWKAQHFSYWMTRVLHPVPGGD